MVRVEINPADADEVDSARREGRPAYLRHLPFGIWLSMAKYEGAPFVKRLQSQNIIFLACLSEQTDLRAYWHCAHDVVPSFAVKAGTLGSAH